MKDTKEKSEVAMVDILSQLSESVNHNWSEFLYVDIQLASLKLENCLIILYRINKIFISENPLLP